MNLQVVRKTTATFAPRASSAKNKNPAQPGTTLYSIFEIQAYISMLFGRILSYNLVFPSDHPDIWRLMGMWSVWMFSKFRSLTRFFVLIFLNFMVARLVAGVFLVQVFVEFIDATEPDIIAQFREFLSIGLT